MNIENIKNSKTKFTGKQIYYYKEIESTQIEAKRIAQNSKVNNGTIIIAESQTKAMGTNKRKWHTGMGKNLAFTIIYYPTCLPEELKNITVEIAEAMVETIYELYKIRLNIKEPNDLMLNGKKIGGILTQTSIVSNHINYLLIGVGFNIKEDNFPIELKEIATSLVIEHKGDYSREKILYTFLENLEEKINYIF